MYGRVGTDKAFQPSLPLRGATRVADAVERGQLDFNPRSPCGERPARVSPTMPFRKRFQPSLPLRGATIRNPEAAAIVKFQPSLPLRGATRRK